MSDGADLRTLLRQAADAAGPFAPPPVTDLTRRRDRRTRARGICAVAASVAAVVAVAGGLAWVTRSGVPRPDRPPTALTLPPPSGPAVTVKALRDYVWAALPRAPIPQRTYAASAWTGRVMVVWGGQAADDSVYADGATYDPATRTWAMLPPSPLAARSQAQSAFVGGSFYVWGGVTDAQGDRALDGARYDLRAGSWAKLPAAPVTSYTWAQLVVSGGRAVLLTSPKDDARTIQADAYDAAHDRWRALPDLSAPPNQEFFDATAIGVGPTILLWRSWSHTTTVSSDSHGVETQGGGEVDAYALDTRSGTWRSVALSPGRGHDASQPLWTGRQVVLPAQDVYCGACSHPMPLSRPGVAIDPVTGRRMTIPSGPVSLGTSAYVWTGAAALGLDQGATIENPGGWKVLQPGDAAAWDPVTNSWTRLRSAAIRGGADGAAIVWAGDRLLVWGLTPRDGAAAGSVGTGLELGPRRASPNG